MRWYQGCQLQRNAFSGDPYRCHHYGLIHFYLDLLHFVLDSRNVIPLSGVGMLTGLSLGGERIDDLNGVEHKSPQGAEFVRVLHISSVLSFYISHNVFSFLSFHAHCTYFAPSLIFV